MPSAPNIPSDEELVRQVRTGSTSSFEPLVRRYEGRVLRFLRRLVGDPVLAEDLTQDTFLKAYRSLHTFDTSRAWRPWLFTIARRMAASHFRAVRPTEPQVPEFVSSDNPVRTVIQRERTHRLWDTARGSLSESQFTALWLHYAEEMPIKEVAQAMDRRETSVKVLLFRARRRMAGVLNPAEAVPVEAPLLKAVTLAAEASRR